MDEDEFEELPEPGTWFYDDRTGDFKVFREHYAELFLRELKIISFALIAIAVLLAAFLAWVLSVQM